MQLTAKPLDAALLGERVDGCRALARVDRASHQDHRARRHRILLRLEHGDRDRNRHGRLADRDHMRVGAKVAQHLNHVIDIIVEAEMPRGQRHHARIRPISDVDLVSGKERLDRAPQKRRVMAGHRSDHENFRLMGMGGGQRPREMDKPPEGTLPHDFLGHGNLFAADEGAGEPELGLLVAARAALEDVAGGAHRAAERRPRRWIRGVFKKNSGRFGRRARGPDQSERSLMEEIGKFHRATPKFFARASTLRLRGGRQLPDKIEPQCRIATKSSAFS